MNFIGDIISNFSKQKDTSISNLYDKINTDESSTLVHKWSVVF